MISSVTNSVCKLSHELPNDLNIKFLGKSKVLEKSQKWIIVINVTCHSLQMRKPTRFSFFYQSFLSRKIFKGILWPIFYIDIIYILTGNEKLCKIYLKFFFFKMFKFLLAFSIDIITSVISSTQIACDVMCVQHLIH